MKTKFLIIIAILAIGIASVLVIGFSIDDGSGQKYQYKFWQKNMEFENNNHFTRVLFSRSDDYGKTFSEPIDMSMTDQNAHEPKMIVMNNDVILVWRDEVQGNTPNISFAKSTDFGKTFEKKRLFYGARPDIKYYDQTLHMTWLSIGSLGPQVLYSKSNDGEETFSKPELIFEVDWQLSPYDDLPTPIIEVDAKIVAITWKMYDKDDQYTIWMAVDDNKDDSFDVKSSPTQRN